MLHAVVMAGGSGTRFWPMSRRNRPKHLLSLAGSQSLLQQTLGRIRPLVPPQRIWVMTGADHATEVQQQLRELPEESIIAEPCRRDTAPCIALAATLASRRDPQAVLAVLPADHVIAPDAEFRRTIDCAASLVAEDARRLVTLGVKPDRPATGYGYIERGLGLGGSRDLPAFAVKKFHEKPVRHVAERYVQSGEFYWNSGVFVWSAATIRDEIQAARPALCEAVERIADAWEGTRRNAVFATEYEQIEGISIDYAVLEKSPNVVVVEAPFRWDDVGSWGAIERLHQTDEQGNVVRGTYCGLESKGNIVLTDPGHLVATVGVENLIIVQCGNATLVADRTKEESVKRLVESVRQQGFEGFC